MYECELEGQNKTLDSIQQTPESQHNFPWCFCSLVGLCKCFIRFPLQLHGFPNRTRKEGNLILCDELPK